MPLTIDSTVLAAWRSGTDNMLACVEIATGHAGTPFIRRTDWDTDITFNSLLFSATPTQFGRIDVTPHSEQGGIDLKLPDHDGAIAALALLAYTFRDTRVRIWLTDLSVTGGSGSGGRYAVYFVESVDVEDGAATFHLRSQFAIFDAQLPRGTMTRTEFPGLPSDTSL